MALEQSTAAGDSRRPWKVVELSGSLYRHQYYTRFTCGYTEGGGGGAAVTLMEQLQLVGVP